MSLLEALDYLKAAMIEVIEIVKLIYQRHSRKCIFSYSIIMENYESEMPHPVSYEFEKSNLNSNPNNSFFVFSRFLVVNMTLLTGTIHKPCNHFLDDFGPPLLPNINI